MASAQGRHAVRPLPVSVVLLVALAGCPENKRAPRADAGVRAMANLVGSELAASPAARCGECHGALESDWRGSAHAKSASSKHYQAMKAAAGAKADCDRCHAPLAALLPEGDPAVFEGVTCDVCHALAPVDGGGFALELSDNVKYAGLCDAKPHYFHKMGCSPRHQKAELCASCHDGAHYPEYREWQALGGEQECQSCHMPGREGETAVGARRHKVPTHGFLALDGRLRTTALRMKVVAAAKDGKLLVDVELENDGAGHQVPTGQAERRVALRVRAAGAEQVRWYGRELLDDAGNPALFFQAVRAGTDTRLKPREVRVERFEFAAAPAGAGPLTAEVLWVDLEPKLAKQLGLESHDETMLMATVPLERLPKTVEVGR